MEATTNQRRCWQISLQEAMIVTGCLAVEAAVARALLTCGTAWLPECLSLSAPFFLVGLPVGIAAGLIAKSWKAVLYGTVAGAAIWLFSILLMIEIHEAIHASPRTVAPGWKMVSEP